MMYNSHTLLHGLRAVVAFCIALLAASCGNKEVVQTPPKTPLQERPMWVDQRPINSAYYIGVGSCSKVAQPLDYQNIAKKNGLNDLATEISVRVEGTTFLNTMEVNKNFSEEFISTINTTTDLQIDEYEIAGTYETEKEFWVYYRLNKAQYQSKKQEKKNQALRLAHDYYIKGSDAEAAKNAPAAIDLYLRGLVSMKDYWAEINEYPASTGGTLFLDNTIYASLRRVVSGLELSCNLEKIELNTTNSFNSLPEITVSFNSLGIRGVEVIYNYKRDKFARPRTGLTDDKGKLRAEVNHVSSTEKNNTLDIMIGMEGLIPQDLDKNLTTGLMKGLRTDSKKIPIELVTPSFFVLSEEKSLGSATTPVLLGAYRSALTQEGMRMSATERDADFLVTITGQTQEGGTSQGFVVAFLELNVLVKNQKTGEIVYQEALSGIKGVQLNANAASIDAFKKGRERIEKEIVPSTLESIL